ncbi:MAG: hypothetical protein WAU65_03235 [Candidatus Nanoarchaeia archaeon]
MRRNKLVVSLIILSLFLIPGISAASINMSMNPLFIPGDDISFNYTLLSNVSENINYTAIAGCPNAPNPLVIINNITLAANVPFSSNYTYISNLTDEISPQKCNAAVIIITPTESFQNMSFLIATDPGFNFNINTCKDSLCTEPSRIFTRGEIVYLNYTSNVANPTLSTLLTLPDNSTEESLLPGSVIVNQTGAYDLAVNASVPRYKNSSLDIVFDVISQEPNIPYTSLVTTNKSFGNLPKYILIIVGIVLLLAVIILWVSLRLIKNKK